MQHRILAAVAVAIASTLGSIVWAGPASAAATPAASAMEVSSVTAGWPRYPYNIGRDITVTVVPTSKPLIAARLTIVHRRRSVKIGTFLTKYQNQSNVAIAAAAGQACAEIGPQAAVTCAAVAGFAGANFIDAFVWAAAHKQCVAVVEFMTVTGTVFAPGGAHSYNGTYCVD